MSDQRQCFEDQPYVFFMTFPVYKRRELLRAGLLERAEEYR